MAFCFLRCVEEVSNGEREFGDGGRRSLEGVRGGRVVVSRRGQGAFVPLGSRCQGYRFRKEDRRPKLLETGAVGRVQGYKRDQQDLLDAKECMFMHN